MSTTKIPEVPKVPNSVITAGPYNDILIAKMKTKADLSSAADLPRGPERKSAVFNALVAEAKKSQAPVLAKLDALQAAGSITSYESMFLPNAVTVKTAPGQYQAVTDALKGIADLESVTQNSLWSVPGKPSKDKAVAPGIATEPEWGVTMIGAPKAWARGYRGQGVVVGVVDTGLDTQHPAIKSHYRGTKADGTVDDNYNWYDPTTPGRKPYDDGQHGTHVGGSVAGGAPEGRQTGVAPDAKLIAAKAILGKGYNTTEATLKALQFMLAPTDLNGKNPDPTKGADVVNNSWGNADQDDRTFIDTWDAFKAAGIISVTAAGNDGPAGKVSPPGSYPNGISVAASNSSDKIAFFSSRGPSKFDPSAVIPMIAAPGAGIVSSIPGGGYARFDGTSMASPHVAGAVALMLSAKPDATYEEITKALASTAVDIDAAGVDKSAGYGRIDVDRAITALLHPAQEAQKTAPAKRQARAA